MWFENYNWESEIGGIGNRTSRISSSVVAVVVALGQTIEEVSGDFTRKICRFFRLSFVFPTKLIWTELDR